MSDSSKDRSSDEEEEISSMDDVFESSRKRKIEEENAKREAAKRKLIANINYLEVSEALKTGKFSCKPEVQKTKKFNTSLNIYCESFSVFFYFVFFEAIHRKARELFTGILSIINGE